MIQHIFLDMDNTLLSPDGSISTKNISVIKNSPIPVSLVSARAPFEMQFAIQGLDLHTTQVAFNGGLIYKPTSTAYQQVYSKAIDPQTAQKIIDVVHQQFPASSLNWYSDTAWYTDKNCKETDFETSITHEKPVISDLPDANQTIYKFMLISFDPVLFSQLVDYLKQLNLANVNIMTSGDSYIEVTDTSATKANAIAQIQAEEHLQSDQLAAFGDGENDIPMFKKVGLPIAVANATEDVKQYAKFISTSNSDDGVANGMQQHVFNK
ncbi:Hydrolase (HAD superfamily) [Pediococcus damnosus]|uniref:HAD family hydrolase n=1 Tax=Pediococcus damnosus TaxID=51663 RepID=UPI00078E488D|nr:HAD family hydrolase [Pediococcus damnosus]AMV60354.1 Hydrolase (HAD superfamily) [Pediococcus damnosus]AMV64604.1 Hydrolase (HAD superfamily) [Pediococcus damnosus]